MSVLLLDRFWPGLARNPHPARHAWAQDFAHAMEAETFHRDREAAVLARLDHVQGQDWGHLLVWAAQHDAERVLAAVFDQPREHWEASWTDSIQTKSWNLAPTDDACEALLRLWPTQYPDLADHLPQLLDRMSDDGLWLAMDLVMGAGCRRDATDPSQAWFDLLGLGRFPFAAREAAKVQVRQREALAQAQRPVVPSPGRPRART